MHKKSEGSERQSRAVVIHDKLRLAILSRQLQPGAKLVEEEIAEVYEVSRTLVRTALQALHHDNLVEIRPRRGAFVAQPTMREAREVFDARLLIEPVVAGLAASRATPEDVQGLQDKLDAERKAMDSHADAQAVLLSSAFHLRIASIAGHDLYASYVRGLCSRSSLIIGQHWRNRTSLCGCDAHQDLVGAIAANRPEEASRIMRLHLEEIIAGVNLEAMEAPRTRLADILLSLDEES
ncbi:GntR family transcriptional regulator [Salipiger abyssi]|uniref:Transcriptional regulator n=1 Tax=Salipiger abyssi TaxID=1250539 RepID=A0A1P8UW51_9RHOB|nr:GntR family transcriptional regulator [Salipiger abyssi]APZ53623.1 transcriptional regulator [Salipiger abyssi]